MIAEKRERFRLLLRGGVHDNFSFSEPVKLMGERAESRGSRWRVRGILLIFAAWFAAASALWEEAGQMREIGGEAARDWEAWVNPEEGNYGLPAGRVELERMLVRWVRPGDVVGVLDPPPGEGGDMLGWRVSADQTRVRLGYLCAPAKVVTLAGDVVPPEVDWLYFGAPFLVWLRVSGLEGEFEQVDVDGGEFHYLAGRVGREPPSADAASLPGRGGWWEGLVVFGSLVALGGAGAVWVARFQPDWQLGREVRVLVGFGIAALYVTSAVWVLWLLGLGAGAERFGAVGGVGLIVALWAARGRAGRVRHGEGGFSWISLAAVAGICGLLRWIVLSRTLFSIPGMGVWGYKARLIHLLGDIPAGLFAGDGWDFCRPEYPLGYPLLLAWIYVWGGEPDRHMVQLVPVVLMGVAAWAMMGVMRARGMPGGLAVALGAAFSLAFWPVRAVENFYAEPLVLVAGLGGCVLVAEAVNQGRSARTWAGAALVAGCGWIKLEGAVVWGAVLLMVVLLRRWRMAGQLAAAGLGLVVPWWVFRRAHGLENPDFDFAVLMGGSWGGIWERVVEAGLRWWQVAVGSPASVGPGWWVLAAAVVLGAPGWLRRADTRFYLGSAILMTAVHVAVFGLSAHGDLDWHLEAMGRLALGPAALVLVASSVAFRKPTDVTAAGSGQARC